MSKRQKEWARNARLRLVIALGGRCVACGATEKLELDCIIPRGHSHHGMASDQRVTFYRRQASVGNLQVLCTRCNAMKGDDSMSDFLARLTTLLESDKNSNSIRSGEYCEQQRKAYSPRENGAWRARTTLSITGRAL